MNDLLRAFRKDNKTTTTTDYRLSPKDDLGTTWRMRTQFEEGQVCIYGTGTNRNKLKTQVFT